MGKKQKGNNLLIVVDGRNFCILVVEMINRYKCVRNTVANIPETIDTSVYKTLLPAF